MVESEQDSLISVQGPEEDQIRTIEEDNRLRDQIRNYDRTNSSSLPMIMACGIISFVVIVCIFILLTVPPPTYSVTLTRLSDIPILTAASSDYDYNYNAAFSTMPDGQLAMIVRAQNHDSSSSDKYAALPSELVIIKSPTNSYLDWEDVREENAVILPTDYSWETLGAEDPRIYLDPVSRKYFMFYTAVSDGTREGDLGSVKARLALATADTLEGPYIQYGPIFDDDDDDWSKSGAVVSTDSENLLLWGDSSICVAHSDNLYDWEKESDMCPICTREGAFDSNLVESGPPPLKLSDGNWFFLYNSANNAGPTIKPGFNLKYELGWAVLQGDNPRIVIERAAPDASILSPVLPWETCNVTCTAWSEDCYEGLTPMVVFVEGWQRLDENSFLISYQGCDSYLSFARVDVEILSS